MPPSLFSGCHIFLLSSETNEEQREREKALGLVSSHHHHSLYLSLSPPCRTFSPLHLSVFLSDSWQPVGYSGHANPSVQIFANWLEKIHIWTWLSHTCCNSVSHIAVLFWAAWTHYCPRSFVAIKTCNSVSTECLLMNPVGRTRGRGCAGSRHKTNRWKQQRWS